MLLEKPLCFHANTQYKSQLFAFCQVDAISLFPKFTFKTTKSSIQNSCPFPIISRCPSQTPLQLTKEQNGENQSFHRTHMAEILHVASVARRTTGCELKLKILVSSCHAQKSDWLQIRFPCKVLHQCLFCNMTL